MPTDGRASGEPPDRYSRRITIIGRRYNIKMRHSNRSRGWKFIYLIFFYCKLQQKHTRSPLTQLLRIYLFQKLFG